MKIKTIRVVVILLLAALGVGTQIYLHRFALQDRIVQTLEHSLHAKASIGSVEWRLLPTPSITITKLKTESETLILTVPTVHLIISPTALLTGSLSLLRSQLVDPEFIITKYPTVDSVSKKIMPFGSVRIKNGTLSLPALSLADDMELNPISMTGITGTLSSRSDRGEFTLTALTNFTKLLHINGSIYFPEGAYQMDITATNFTSGRLITDQSTHSPLPKISNMTFSSHLEGLGVNHFTLHLASNDTPFLVQDHAQTVEVAGIDCIVSRNTTQLDLDIKHLSLKSPAMSLSGRVTRQGNNTNVPQQPKWDIDVLGKEIDISATRSAIMTKFPSHPIAQKVCGIVQGGHASTARFTFKGEVSDFHHWPSLKIWADAVDVPLVIPKIELVLDRTSGPIRIIDGQLTGENLTADIDKSHGENGTLLVDLRHDHHAFHLDLDLTADLKNLKDVLTQVVHIPKFQKELKQFSAIDGQAKGHLRLGDDLHHVQTNVDVISMQAKGKYNRLPWPFTITAGRLMVGPQQVEWQDVKGSIGNQRVNKSHGSVNWQDGVEVDLDSLDASLDLGALFEEGSLTTNTKTLSVHDFFHGNLNRLLGKATIASTSFLGRIGQPEQWKFASTFSISDLLVSGPTMPEVSSRTVQGEISHNDLRFSGIVSILNNELFLNGLYTHTLLDRLQGELTINGDIGQQLGEWIQEKQKIPTPFFPNLPFHLEQFSFTTPEANSGSLKAGGTIISLAEGSMARVQLDINRQPDQVTGKATFVDGPKTGTVSYLAWPLQENHTLMTWQGDLDVRTFDELFSQYLLRDGSIQGAFTRLSQKESVIYSGDLLFNEIRFGPEALLPEVAIEALRLSGDASDVVIDHADVTLDDSHAQVSGKVSEHQGKMTVDLTLTAPALSSTSIKKQLSLLQKTKDAQQRSSLRRSVNGTISFNIDNFDFVRTTPQSEPTTSGAESAHILRITPFNGVLSISPDTIDLAFDDSSTCGLSVQGSWYFGNQTKDNELSFSSDRSPVYFEQALPCLGFKQSLIVGPFTIDGKITGIPGNWRHGTIALASKEGLIKRMNLLSEIFTAVNFTDYLTWQDTPNMTAEGLAFNALTVNAHIENNLLTLDKTAINGKGVNLTGRGTINLSNLDSDLTFFVAPFKMVDSVVTNIPLLGKALGGSKESILTFPVKVNGNIKSPEVTSLAPEAVGTAAWELLIDTLTLPYRIFQPTKE